MRALVLFFLSTLCLSANAQSLKIGFIDTEQVIVNLTQYKNSVDKHCQENLSLKNKSYWTYSNILSFLEQNIEFNKKINTLDSNEMELAKLKDLEESFEKETEFWQKSMNSNKINLLNKIENLINISINDYAIEEGYDLILYKDVAFVSDKVNITQQIIEKIEKQ